MDKQQFEAIPGLFVYPTRFSGPECASLVGETLSLYIRLEEASGGAKATERAHIPQPEFVRSSAHNLASEERYVRVSLVEDLQRTLKCEYFPKYGEEGHSLAYFRGNDNLPDYVRDSLLGSIHQTLRENGLVEAGRELLWKLTVNYYRNVAGTVAGFPFHVDIPANGVVTMTLNIQREVLFQIARNDAITDIRLPVGALLILSGESRYEWKHRVLPMESSGSVSVGGVERVSLVLGFQ